MERIASTIECRVGSTLIAVPSAKVLKVSDLRVHPVPLAGAHIAGLALFDGRLLCAVRLGPPREGVEPFESAAVIVTAGEWACAFLIDQVVRFADVAIGGGKTADWPAWIVRATDPDGQVVGLLDAERLAQGLSAARWTS